MSRSGRSRLLLALATAAALATSAVGCSVGNSGLGEDLSGRGPITFVEGADTTGAIPQLVALWNSQHPGEKVSYKQQPASADDQLTDFRENLSAKRSDYDVLSLDVVWTSEFAARGWVEPLVGPLTVDTKPLLAAAVSSGVHHGQQYAIPKDSGAGLLFYRTDLMPDGPPKTWHDMMAACPIAKQHNIICYGGQFAPYEGLTVNTAEAIYSNGGSFVGPDGQTPTVDSPEGRAGLQQIVEAFNNGNIAREEVGWKEDQGLAAFAGGKLMFLRMWASAFDTLSADSSAVHGKFAVAPLPGVNGPGVSTIGGHNLAISAFSKHKATAADFIRFATGEAAQRILAEKAMAPALMSLYDDPQLTAKFSYLPILKTGLQHAQPRPATPFYAAVSKAIYTNAGSAFRSDGPVPVGVAISNMQASIAAAAE